MKNFNFITIIIMGLALGACAPQPKPIEYGADGCVYCQMTIVDRQHAAEAVTDKGKVYKFDAIECMMNYTLQNPEMEMAFLLVNPYSQPGALVSVEDCTFLISPNLPSPMGAYLSAFPSTGEAQAMQREHGGTAYQWNELRSYFKEKGENYYMTNQLPQ